MNFFRRIAEHCPFLTGEGGYNAEQPFYADLEWLMKVDNYVKVREGRYVA